MSAEILIVDDEKDIRLLIKGILEDEGYVTREAANSDEAALRLTEKSPDLVVLDIWLQESEHDGLNILKDIKARTPHLPVLMISGHGTIETAVTAIKDGAYDFIEKPFKSNRLLLMIERALEVAALKRENESLKARHKTRDDFVGASPQIMAIKNQIAKIAPTKSRVLITGDQGTGKEVAAREIHALSTRSDKAFSVINCAVLHPERLEEELFGYNKDGVHYAGVLEQSDGGTMLLDEVADMPLETQGKILRVLQDNQIQPLGAQHKIDIDVRFMASSNRDLLALIEKGDFREDLYYRLNVVPIELPPLHERKGDALMLMRHFLAQGLKRDAVEFDEGAIEAIKSYAWPGNVRQLKNAAEWMMIMMQSSDDAARAITLDDLPPEISQKKKPKNEDGNMLKTQPEELYGDLALKEARALFEQNYLSKQLERFEGNVSKMAEFVGMDRAALHRKLKALDILGVVKQNANKADLEPNRKVS